MAITTLSARQFIALVNEAYPEVGMLSLKNPERQTILLWRVLRALTDNPELLETKSVRHNLGRPKMEWLEHLKSRLEEDLHGTV